MGNYSEFDFILSLIERPWHSKPSEFASVTAEGPIFKRASRETFAKVVLFKNSITDRPLLNLADLDVGKTWLGPVT